MQPGKQRRRWIQAIGLIVAITALCAAIWRHDRLLLPQTTRSADKNALIHNCQIVSSEKPVSRKIGNKTRITFLDFIHNGRHVTVYTDMQPGVNDGAFMLEIDGILRQDVWKRIGSWKGSMFPTIQKAVEQMIDDGKL